MEYKDIKKLSFDESIEYEEELRKEWIRLTDLYLDRPSSNLKKELNVVVQEMHNNVNFRTEKYHFLGEKYE